MPHVLDNTNAGAMHAIGRQTRIGRTHLVYNNYTFVAKTSGVDALHMGVNARNTIAFSSLLLNNNCRHYSLFQSCTPIIQWRLLHYVHEAACIVRKLGGIEKRCVFSLLEGNCFFLGLNLYFDAANLRCKTK
jgi:hypothetical protein